nr:hypothetical protein [Acidovorax sp. 16-64-162]
MNLLHMRRREVLHPGAQPGQPFAGLGVVLQGGLQAIDLTLDGKEVGLMNVGPHEPFGHTLLLAERPIELTWVASSNPTTAAVMERDKALQLLAFPEMMAMVAPVAPEPQGQRTATAHACGNGVEIEHHAGIGDPGAAKVADGRRVAARRRRLAYGEPQYPGGDGSR